MINNLNPQQKKAVEHLDGPILILAGAGSGKTRVLTNRISFLIREGITPYNILAMTFTNKAANEIKERVKKDLDLSSLDINIGTFHSICLKLLRIYGKYIGLDSNFIIYDANDTKSLIKRIIKDRVNISVKELKNYISRKKRAGYLPGNISTISFIDERLIDLYWEYQNSLNSANALDFDDLILKVVKELLENKEVKEKICSKFKYILIDEYQDINNIQFKLIKKLSLYHNNIFVVGDDDQTIYGFRGSNVGNIFKFEKAFPNTKIIKLEQNYRSTTNILNISNEIIKKNVNRKGKKLWTGREKGEEVTFIQAIDENEEAEKIVEEIYANKYKYNNTAILYRTNSQSRIIEEKLIKYNIPYEIIGSLKFYDRKEIKDIISYIRLIVNENDTQAFIRVINFPPRGIGKVTQEKILLYSQIHNISPLKTIELSTDLTASQKKKLIPFLEFINKMKVMIDSKAPDEFIDILLEKSGYQQYLIEKISKGDLSFNDRIENIKEFKNGINNFIEENPSSSIKEYLQNISLISDIDLFKDEINKIKLMTIHSSKGLEFNIVFISGVENGLIPHSRCETLEEIEEERRLLYVAATRAKDKLYILFSRERYYRSTEPSEFITHILFKKRDKKTVFKKKEKIIKNSIEGRWYRHKYWGKVQLLKKNGKKAVLRLEDGSYRTIIIDLAPIEPI